MRRSLLGFTVLAVAVLLLPAVSASGANSHANYRAVCPGRVAGTAHCQELVVTDAHGNPLASSSPTGLGPSQIYGAYGFSGLSGAGETIAIVDAYDDPSAESDLNTFSGPYGLPACTSSNGCFTKVNQTGGTSYPRANAGWALEISLDVQWAHAVAPQANILLVEASSNSFANLMAAESYASAHADYVSNSWGGSEFSGENAYDSYFSTSSVSYFVAAGDSGGSAAEYPSASPNVISVGGTTLNFDQSGNFVSETGWSSGGGGCSLYEQANPAQSSYSHSLCGSARATPDVSLDADPNSGVSVYDSVKYYGQTGWFTVGGTSASTPMWAARSADSGSPVNASTVYSSAIPFRDITSGNNGNPCLPGYDLCTGRGSWNDGGSGGGTTATAPGAPSSLSASAGDGSVQLSWTAPSSDGGSAVTGYDIYRGTSSGGETLVMSNVAGTTYTDMGLTNGTRYYYEVTAVNSIGESSPSNEVSATPQSSTVSAPTAPQNLSAATAKGRGIQLSWSAPSSDGGSAITGYNLYRSNDGTSFAEIATSTSTSYKDTQTARGATYYYEVTAVNAVGESTPSNIATGKAK